MTDTDARRLAAELYTPPFRYECGYIWDAAGHMVADSMQEHGDSTLRVRGWGRIQYLGDRKQAVAIQDAVGERIARILSEHWTDAAALAWAEGQASCRVCNGSGWNHGAQPGPGPGYKTLKCTVCDYWTEQAAPKE